MDMDLYPTVGLQHSGDSIRVNFGHDPFKYDIDYHVQQQRNVIWTEILGTNLDSHRLLKASTNQSNKDLNGSALDSLSQDRPKTILEDLVVTYLMHHGYRKTARAFQKQNNMATESTKANSSLKIEDADMEDMVIIPPNIDTLALVDDVDPRTKIVASVNSGDVDLAISDTQKHYPDVLLAEDGLILFKLRCRKFIELILETAEMKKRLQPGGQPVQESGSSAGDSWMDEDGMDVDEDVSPQPPTSSTLVDGHDRDKSVSPSRNGPICGIPSAQYESALNKAISYGQTLTNDYKNDGRREVRQIFKQTFSIVAWEDPLSAESGAADIAGDSARVALANELNMAILSI